MIRANDKPGARANELTGPDSNERFKRNYSRHAEAVQIHRACNLLADSAIAADDAVVHNDPDAVDNAIRAVKKNARAVCKLCLAWRSHA